MNKDIKKHCEYNGNKGNVFPMGEEYIGLLTMFMKCTGWHGCDK